MSQGAFWPTAPDVGPGAKATTILTNLQVLPTSPAPPLLHTSLLPITRCSQTAMSW